MGFLDEMNKPVVTISPAFDDKALDAAITDMEMRRNKLQKLAQLEVTVSQLELERIGRIVDVDSAIIGAIVEEVCLFTKQPLARLVSKERCDEVVCPRLMIWHFARVHMAVTLESLGEVFNRDHTTVTHGLKAYQSRVETDLVFKKQAAVVEVRINERLKELPK